MSNNRPDRQHTVPQVYLRSFADRMSQVGVANLIAKRIYSNNITNVSVVDKFYNVYTKEESGKYLSPYYYEKLLSKIEGDVSRIIKDVVKDLIWPLPWQDRLLLAKFISTQFVRGHDKRDIRDSWNSYITQARIALAGKDAFLANATSLIERKQLEEEWGKMEEGSLEIKFSSTDHTLTFLSEVETYITSIDNRIWHLYHFDDLSLVTCDNPVVIIRNEIEITPDLTPDDITGIDDSPYLYYPLSRKMGILMIHPTLVDHDEIEDIVITQKNMTNSTGSWQEFNKHIIKNAHKEIYCHSDDVVILPNPLPEPANLKINGPTFLEWVDFGNYLRESTDSSYKQ